MSSMSRNLSLQKHITPATVEKYERQRVVFPMLPLVMWHYHLV